MAQVNKYNHSKIYKISSNLTDKIYVGSTTQTLAQRLSKHTSDYRQYVRTNNVYVSSFEIIKLGDSYITLIEECNFNNKSQLFKREGEIIKLNLSIVVNKMIQGRTGAEWRVDNKEQLSEYNKQHYNNNKEHRIECTHQYYINNNELILDKKKQYRQDNHETILERDRQYYNDNKHVILEQRKQPIICECGIIYTRGGKLQHMKSIKHINLIQQLFNNELNHYTF